ncbi:MAG: 5'-deoxynucleotidase [Clostridia bacterium]|nr:5'-deoxynucleotidase [Clostridia bacterium]
MSRSFFAFLSRMKYINRWALMRNTRPENICEHSQDVAVLAHALAVLQNKRFGPPVDAGRCVLLALYHDAPEIFTGDLPTPVKYGTPAIQHAYKEIEREAADRLLAMLPEDMQPEYRPWLTEEGILPEEKRLVKAADKLAALIKCAEELEQGNREFRSAYDATLAAVRRMQLPAADCFVEEFLPAFSRTLDEQR